MFGIALRKSFILVGLCFSGVLLYSCQDNKEDVLPDNVSSVIIQSVSTASSSPEGNTGTGANTEDLLDEAAFSSKVAIHFGTTTQIINPLEDSGVLITESNGHVIIQAIAEGIDYELSGATENGSVKIYSETKFKLSLKGVQLTNPIGPAVNIQSQNRAFVHLAANTENKLVDGNNYITSTTEDRKGTVFSEGILLISGKGKLTINSNYGHALVSDQYIRLQDGTLIVENTKKDGIHTNDAVIIDGGSLTIAAAEDDGIQCEKGPIIINNGTITINSTGKAITASYETNTTYDPYLTINGGKIVINTADEGIESKSVLTINAGDIQINAKDDAINAGTFVYINGGTIYAHSTNNDGIDSNGPLTITGGQTFAIGSRNPEGGIDCDRSTFKVTGGVLVGLGGSTSSPTTQVSTQPSVILGGGNSGEVLSIISTDAQEALTFKSPISFATLLFSSPKLLQGKTYTVYSGGEITAQEDFFGLYTNGSYQNGQKSATTFTTSSMVTHVGGNIGPGGRP